MEATYTYYKTPNGWAFDDPANGVWEEAMVNGSEKALDYWYTVTSKTYPNSSSWIKATVSDQAGDHTTFSLIKKGKSVGGTDYTDSDGVAWWFCPYLNYLFGASPESLFVTILETDHD